MKGASNGSVVDVHTAAISLVYTIVGWPSMQIRITQIESGYWLGILKVPLTAYDPLKVICTINEGNYGSGPNKTRLSV